MSMAAESLCVQEVELDTRADFKAGSHHPLNSVFLR